MYVCIYVMQHLSLVGPMPDATEICGWLIFLVVLADSACGHHVGSFWTAVMRNFNLLRGHEANNEGK